MMKVATAREMKRIDAVTIRRFRLAGAILMERAGLAVASRINELYFPKEGTRHRSDHAARVCILCGGGNNGGDGLVIARLLHGKGRNVEVYLSAPPRSLSGEALTNYKAARSFGLTIHPVRDFLKRYTKGSARGTVIVDALLGTGLARDVRDPLSAVIRRVNALPCAVLSVDIPSGISSDTGQIMGCAVRAEHTMTFGLPKRGHFLHPGAEYAGVLTVADIGFPNELLESGNIPVSLPDEADIRRMLPARPRYSHKGTYGHVLLVAGSRGKTGAALMAARACLRAGAGLLTMGIPETLTSSLQSRVTEEMILPLPDQGNGTLSVKAAQTIIHFLSRKGIVLALGPGLSVNSEIADLVRTVVEETAAPMVIDADGLNALGSGISLLRKRSLPAVITPHPGEMVRLFQGRLPFRSADEKTIMKGIEEDRIGRAQAFARKMGVCLVLKGAPTVTAIPDGSVYINPTGNAGLASAGSGDVLTGIAAAFLAQGMLPREAALSAVYIHGLTGDRVAGKKGQHSLIASDLIRSLPQTLKYLAPA